MDSFTEPKLTDQASLEDVRQQVSQLQDAYRAKGLPLSGRVLHVCHQLPVRATLHNTSPGGSSNLGVPSPPSTPPQSPGGLKTPSLTTTTTATTQQDGGNGKPRWTLAPRYGHAAMIAGIRSLGSTHEQLIVGWTGDIESPLPNEKITAVKVSNDDREAYVHALDEYATREEEEQQGENGKRSTTTGYVPVWMDDKVAHGHYDGYCKQTLWPLFHYLLWQDVATEYTSADAPWASYVAANEAFADAIARVHKPGDLVWVHDYHLLLVPKLLRERVPDAAIGLFVHTPFPSSEVFRCLPRRKELLDGMLGANLISFQTYSYSRHFTSTCVRVCGYEINSRGIDNQGHLTAIGHCPVGVDADRVARDTFRPGIPPKVEALKALYEGKKIIVGRDKLDVVKGILHKLRAFGKLLREYPDWVGQVVMIQVTSPALTDSPKLERQVSELVSQINGEFGSLDFIPVHHYHQTLKKDEFYALLSVADLAVITPLRDGMNTTSMEFVIAQEKTKKSPLVLSEFMGISSHMNEALQTNPWNLDDVAAAMHHGLTMSEMDKVQRHEKLYKVVTTHTAHKWAATLVQQLLAQLNSSDVARSTPFIPSSHLEEYYRNSRARRLFLFDYDGTLTPIVKVPSMALPSEHALEALGKLSEDERNVVFIISGRDQEFLETHFGKFKKLGLSAEHGAFIREPGSTRWSNFTETMDMDWMQEVHEIFKYYTERTTGSQIEMKKSSITWHYRGADPEWGQFQCRQCQDLLENNLAHKRPIEVLIGKKNLEVRPVAINKGEIVKRIVYNHPEADFIFCAGDDKTDEDMFRALNAVSGWASAGTPMEPPLSVTLVNGNGNGSGTPKEKVELAIKPQAIFTTSVGHSSKRTLANWHVTSPEEIVEHMLVLVNGTSAGDVAAEDGKSSL